VLILFQYVKRVPVVMLHTDSAKDGSHGARSASLLADDLADITGCDPQPQHSALFSFNSFNYNSFRLIDQGAGNFCYQLLHVIRAFYVRHRLAPLEDVGISLSGSRHSISNFAQKDRGIL
jgi:hypothetical protein